MRQIILDTETTGLEPELGHRIIEIGCIEVVAASTDGTGVPLLPLPGPRQRCPGALQVHGLTEEFLTGKRPSRHRG